jgi:hypothetical protein
VKSDKITTSIPSRNDFISIFKALVNQIHLYEQIGIIKFIRKCV